MSTPTASPRMIHMIEAVTDRLEGSPRQLRRFWSDEFKVEAVEEACRPGVNISAIARRIGITPSQLYRWRRDLLNESEPDHVASAESGQRSMIGVSSVVEVVIGDVVIRAGAEIGEAHLQRVIRAVRSA
ncbi:transposase [Ensifer adhaerens]|nr:transposase [Ensifer adhaerens]UAX95113.1 transposase [Ensifer adhaerens]UAX99998.1 transposase [Ensifer adhaerens]UAY02996.1 transposase [Ensifer adhaerens]UAY07382.1 transposase [Ensifer adhaerens]